jgi:hypothetical protein
MSLYGQNVIVYAALREELQVNREVVSSYAYAYALGQLSSDMRNQSCPERRERL